MKGLFATLAQIGSDALKISFTVNATYQPTIKLIKANRNGQTVGSYLWDSKSRSLKSLYVPKKMRQQGIAKLLVKHCKDTFGLPINLDAVPFSDGQMSKSQLEAFYTRCGFKKSASDPRFMVMAAAQPDQVEVSGSTELHDVLHELRSHEPLRMSRALARFKRHLLATADDNEEAIHDHYQKLIKQLNAEHEMEINRYHEQLSFRQRFIDASADQFIQEVSASVYDDTSAAGAIQYYSHRWFNQQPYSYEVLQRVAGTLIDTVKQYRVWYPPLWDKIARGNIALEIQPVAENQERRILRSRLLNPDLINPPEDQPGINQEDTDSVFPTSEQRQ